jgi:hypothetical protein
LEIQNGANGTFPPRTANDLEEQTKTTLTHTGGWVANLGSPRMNSRSTIFNNFLRVLFIKRVVQHAIDPLAVRIIFGDIPFIYYSSRQPLRDCLR